MAQEEELGKKVELAWLESFYGGLLTEKQRQVLTLHCDEDMSLTEIAQMTGISRQGAHEQLTRAAERLNELEKALGMAARFRKMEQGLADCRTALTDKRYDDAEVILNELIRQQEESNGL